MRKIVTVLVAVLVLGLSQPTEAAHGEQAKGKGKPSKSDKKPGGKNERDSGVEFSVEFLLDFSSKEARRIAEQSGLVRHKPLPPGIAKNLARGKPLPPGIAKREMPDSFLTKLPKHDDYEWHMAGVDLVLTARVDGLVKEVVRDVFK